MASDEPDDSTIFARTNPLNPLVRLELIACENTLNSNATHQEELYQKQLASWDFLASKGISKPHEQDFNPPCDIIRSAFVKFMHTAVVFAQHLHRLMAAVARIQRFYRSCKDEQNRRIEAVHDYWVEKEAVARHTMRDRIQRYKKANPNNSLFATGTHMLRDYLQARVPRALKLRAISETIEMRKHSWRKEWREYKKLQTKVRSSIPVFLSPPPPTCPRDASAWALVTQGGRGGGRVLMSNPEGA